MSTTTTPTPRLGSRVVPSRNRSVARNAEPSGRPATRVWWWVAAACAFVAAVHLMFILMPLGIDAGGVALIGHRLLESHEHGASLYGDLWIDRPPLVILIYGAADAIGGSIGVRIAGLLAAMSIVILAAVAARRLGRPDAVPIVATIAAILSASPALGIHGVPQELFAAPLSAGAVVCLLPALRGTLLHWRAWFAAGLLAVCAILVKQSFIDGLAAVTAIAILAPVSATQSRTRVLLMLAAGAAVPTAGVLIWAGMEGPGVPAMLYAMWGFRVDGAEALAHASVGLSHRFQMLAAGALAAGLPLLLPACLAGILMLRRTTGRAATAVTATWLGVGCVGVAGGGYYWTHYMIQLIPSVAVLGGIGIHDGFATSIGRRVALMATSSLIVGASVLAFMTGTLNIHQYRAASAATYLRANAAPDDRLLVMYARANLLHDAKMTPAFTYQWSLMYRALPEAERRLRALLSSPRRPSWIAEYQRPRAFELDRSGRTQQLLDRYYRTTDVVCGVPILLRVDDPRSTNRPPHLRCPDS